MASLNLLTWIPSSERRQSRKTDKFLEIYNLPSLNYVNRKPEQMNTRTKLSQDPNTSQESKDQHSVLMSIEC